MKRCHVYGCKRPANVRGMCWAHYQRHMHHTHPHPSRSGVRAMCLSMAAAPPDTPMAFWRDERWGP